MKEINWVDRNGPQASSAKRLHDLILTVIRIIENDDEYKKLPPPKGAYL